MARVNFFFLAAIAVYLLDRAAAVSGDIQNHFTLRTGAAQSEVRLPCTHRAPSLRGVTAWMDVKCLGTPALRRLSSHLSIIAFARLVKVVQGAIRQVT